LNDFSSNFFFLFLLCTYVQCTVEPNIFKYFRSGFQEHSLRNSILFTAVRVAFLQHEEDVLWRLDRCWKPHPGSGSTGEIAPVKRNDVRPFVNLAELARRLFIHVSRPLTVAGHHLDAALIPARDHAAGRGLLSYHAQANEGKVGLHCLLLVSGDPALRISPVNQAK